MIDRPSLQSSGWWRWAAGFDNVWYACAFTLSTGKAFNLCSRPSFYRFGAGIQLNPGKLTVANSFSVNAILNGVLDGDFGATPAVFTPSASSGCAQSLVTLQHKAGIMFVLSASNMSKSLGSYQLADSTEAGQFIGSTTYSAAHNLLLVVAPSDATAVSGGSSATYTPAVQHGLQAYTVTASCGLLLAWQTTLGLPWDPTNLNSNAPYSSPTVANGV